ncbi:hypothetical protein V1527DRAFT_478423 [Lipomyces starkeyi]
MPAIRKKVCSQCREARTRCSLDIPKCKRCLGRNFKCDYTETRRGVDRAPWRRAAELPTFFTDPVPEFLESLTGTDVAQRSSGQRNNDIRDNEELVSETDWNEDIIVAENTRAMLQSSGEICTDTTILSYESQNDASTNDFRSPLSTEFVFNLQELLTHYSPNNTGTFDEFLPIGGWLSPINPSITDYPLTSAGAGRNRPLLLTQKKTSTISQSLSSNHLFKVLLSYPTDLLSGISLPPFIHPHTYCPLNRSKCACDSVLVHHFFPTPLANCISIMHMWQTRTPESKALVWRTIMSEQQRLSNEYHQYDDLNLLSAFQAITIYLLLQAREKDLKEHECVRLLWTTGKISAKAFIVGYKGENKSNSILPSWEEWAFRESMRRTFMVLFLIALLIETQTDYWPTCSSGLMEAFLPCSEDLWKSSNREDWEAKYKHDLERRQSTEMLKFKTLKNSQQFEQGTDETACLEDLKDWGARGDAFGATVMMAALML